MFIIVVLFCLLLFLALAGADLLVCEHQFRRVEQHGCREEIMSTDTQHH